jgi:hypothetical protein
MDQNPEHRDFSSLLLSQFVATSKRFEASIGVGIVIFELRSLASGRSLFFLAFSGRARNEVSFFCGSAACILIVGLN